MNKIRCRAGNMLPATAARRIQPDEFLYVSGIAARVVFTGVFLNTAVLLLQDSGRKKDVGCAFVKQFLIAKKARKY